MNAVLALLMLALLACAKIPAVPGPPPTAAPIEMPTSPPVVSEHRKVPTDTTASPRSTDLEVQLARLRARIDALIEKTNQAEAAGRLRRKPLVPP